ncbi:hypothetical protein [Haloarchaeobius litoreus]|uniref:ArsR family transcriptional regulator n=1 Tax=Haloarchaeobius litoreus TaxID=755306 RepID=A0ABD6DNJ0_9EURY|nr:hypothetical protein [Haloarchaeobius litoreus]
MDTDQTRNYSAGTGDADDSKATGDPASLSEMLGVLDSRPRRRILFTLLHEDGKVPIESLARTVAAPEFSPVADGETRSDRETV